MVYKLESPEWLTGHAQNCGGSKRSPQILPFFAQGRLGHLPHQEEEAVTCLALSSRLKTNVVVNWQRHGLGGEGF
jgi:hypothetical protein